MKQSLKTLSLGAIAIAIASCSDNDILDEISDISQSDTPKTANRLTATNIDEICPEWQKDDEIALVVNGTVSTCFALHSGAQTETSEVFLDEYGADTPLMGVYPASALTACSTSCLTVEIPTTQTPDNNGFDRTATVRAAQTTDETLRFGAVGGGIRLNFSMSGITRIEIESVDGYPIAGEALITFDGEGIPVATTPDKGNSIIVFEAATPEGLTPGIDYTVATYPCDVYGGYRLSIFRDGLVAHYFGVHQQIERAEVITPLDLNEQELEFGDPDAPLVEEERPELDAITKALVSQYRRNPTDENKQALLLRMGVRYDKVVARKKAKLRELEREAKTHNLIAEMQEIVDEMVKNRDIRIEQQFLRLIDPRTDDNPNDRWLVLRGASAANAYVAYAPVTNAEYAAFKPNHSYPAGHENYPVVNITVADANNYCNWLSANDKDHTYRLPSDEEWVLAAGHMPKDVAMNAGKIEPGLTDIYAYSSTTGACGGIDFWGNCWEWTCSFTAEGLYIVKGGSWDSSRDDCRSEKSDVLRSPTIGYENVGMRVVRTDRDEDLAGLR